MQDTNIAVRNYLRSKITPLVDDVQTEVLGGIFGIKNSAAENAPRIMVAAHMDEVGFMVSDIKADGTMRAVGYWWVESFGAKLTTFYSLHT